MSKSDTKKALEALQQRVETVELNGDMIEKAIGKESYEQTVKCKDEIKTVLEGYKRLQTQVKNLNKRVSSQKGQLKVFYKKQGKTKSEKIIETIVDNIELLKKKEGYDVTVNHRKYVKTNDTGFSPFTTSEIIGSKTEIVIKKGAQVDIRCSGDGTTIAEDDKDE